MEYKGTKIYIEELENGKVYLSYAGKVHLHRTYPKSDLERSLKQFCKLIDRDLQRHEMTLKRLYNLGIIKEEQKNGF